MGLRSQITLPTKNTKAHEDFLVQLLSRHCEARGFRAKAISWRDRDCFAKNARNDEMPEQLFFYVGESVICAA